jgi:hypothetical protein
MHAETDLGFANSPTMSVNALGDSEDDHDAPLHALALYEIPAGVTLEDPCAYTEKHEIGGAKLHLQLLPSSMTSKISTLWSSWSWKKKKSSNGAQ